MLDKEWVHLSRADPGYEIGAWNFVHSVGVSSGDTDMVVCPCTDCRNMDRHLGCDVVDHLVRRGMDESYKQQIDWYHHGDGRFDLDGDAEKACVMKQMGCIWRSAKSRMVDKIRQAKNNTERMQLRPKNVSIAEWRKFIKEKTSQEFKVISDKFKERRIVNTNAAQKISKAAVFIQAESPSSTSTNPKEDMLTQVLGPDNPGWLRAMGRGMSMSKLVFFQMRNKYMIEMQKNQANLQKEVQKLGEALIEIKTQKPESECSSSSLRVNSGPRSVNTRKQPKCDLYDYSGGDEKVAEGHILSSDPEDFVNDIPLGPNSVKVLVQTAIKPSAFLWRPAANLFSIEESVGEIIAWPQRFAVLHDQGYETEDNDPKSPNTYPTDFCKLLDWATTDEEVVCEGRWFCQDPKALVNGIQIGPNAVKVFIDEVIVPETFLWRPTAELSTVEDCLKSFVAWPKCRVIFIKNNFETPFPDSPVEQSVPTPPAPSPSQNLSQPSTGQQMYQQHCPKIKW